MTKQVYEYISLHHSSEKTMRDWMQFSKTVELACFGDKVSFSSARLATETPEPLYGERVCVYQFPPVLVHQEILSLRNVVLNPPPGPEIIPSWYLGKKPTFKQMSRVFRGLIFMYAGSTDRVQHAKSAPCSYLIGGTGCRVPYVASLT